MALKRRCGNLYLLLVVLVPRENQHAAQGFDHHVYIRRYCPRAARLKVSICDRLIGAAAVVADATANGASRAIAAAAVLLNYVSSGCAAQAGGGGYRGNVTRIQLLQLTLLLAMLLVLPPLLLLRLCCFEAYCTSAQVEEKVGDIERHAPQ